MNCPTQCGVTLMTSSIRTIRTATIDQHLFHEQGWLVVKGALGDFRLRELESDVGIVASWAEDQRLGLHHFERTDAGAVLARSEQFVDHHSGLRSFVTAGVVTDIAAQLLGEPVVLFKEKINYKYPGGGGFAPHQDATAYRFVDHHISCMVPLDPATRASGCLFVASGHHAGPLPTDQRGRIADSTAAALDWQPVPLQPGDLLFFDSYTPHYSDSNTTDHPRRALYLTYNAGSFGDHRANYYADKRAEFARADPQPNGDHVRLSITDDFLGRPVG